MADVLRPLGYAMTDAPEGADLVVLNTCHIREKASEKLYSDLGRLKPMKSDAPGMQVIVAGCVASSRGFRDHHPRAGGGFRWWGRSRITACRNWWPRPHAPQASG